MHNLAAGSRRPAGTGSGLVVFAAKPWIVCPLTSDYDHFRARLDEFTPNAPPPETATRAGRADRHRDRDRRRAPHGTGCPRSAVPRLPGHPARQRRRRAGRRGRVRRRHQGGGRPADSGPRRRRRRPVPTTDLVIGDGPSSSSPNCKRGSCATSPGGRAASTCRPGRVPPLGELVRPGDRTATEPRAVRRRNAAAERSVGLVPRRRAVVPPAMRGCGSHDPIARLPIAALAASASCCVGPAGPPSPDDLIRRRQRRPIARGEIDAAEDSMPRLKSERRTRGSSRSTRERHCTGTATSGGPNCASAGLSGDADDPGRPPRPGPVQPRQLPGPSGRRDGRENPSGGHRLVRAGAARIGRRGAPGGCGAQPGDGQTPLGEGPRPRRPTNERDPDWDEPPGRRSRPPPDPTKQPTPR